MQEIELFSRIFEIDRLMYLLDSRSDSIISGSANKHVQAILRDLSSKKDSFFDQLPLFGVNPTADGGQKTAEFRAWFKWWKDFVLNLPEEKRLEIITTETKTDLRPTGTWRDLIGKC
jgi:hypothetical protein